jgi:hypothetical protein
MPAFTVSPLPASLVDQARSAALADGTAVEVTGNDDAPFPVRCCLRDATAEEGVLLLSMQPRSGGSPTPRPGRSTSTATAVPATAPAAKCRRSCAGGPCRCGVTRTST